MGIYIPNMEMPTRCENCFCYRHNAEYDYAYCNISSVNVLGHGNARLNNCPLVPVPPHGRLIDADAAIKVWEVRLSDGDSCSFRNIETTVSKFLLSHLMGEVPPTIIPAEEGEI